MWPQSYRGGGGLVAGPLLFFIAASHRWCHAKSSVSCSKARVADPDSDNPEPDPTLTIFEIFLHYYFVREAAKMFFFWVARPLRPYPPPLSDHIFGEILFRASPKKNFLVARPLPSPLLVAGPLKKFLLRLTLIVSKLFFWSDPT